MVDAKTANFQHESLTVSLEPKTEKSGISGNSKENGKKLAKVAKSATLLKLT